jgi:hypothetical protein
MNTGYIYIIRSKKTDNVYIGSTKHTILKRFKQHEHEYDTGKNKCQSHNIIKYGDAFCEKLEIIKYDDIKELRNRERDIIQSNEYKCVNTMWNTREEDDVVHNEKTTKKSIKNIEKNTKDKIIAEKIIDIFELDVEYSKDEFMNKAMKIEHLREFKKTNSDRKLIWEVKKLLSLCQMDIYHIRKHKTINKIKNYVPKYKMCNN